ncbi:MAG: ATP-dependent zinc metalloprotease FtsH [candidate division Zixibacteria bacterium]|nr:ATP-dependent zinc metalloprotease FtsH [candidate division Zixibacteria bacterium]
MSNFDQDRRSGREPSGNRQNKDKKDEFQWKRNARPLFFWLVIVLVLIFFIKFYYSGQTELAQITYSEFLSEVDKRNVTEVVFVDHDIHGKFREPYSHVVAGESKAYDDFRTRLVFEDPSLLTRLEESNVQIKAEEQPFSWLTILGFAPWLLLIVFWIFMMRQMQGGGGPKGLFSFGKSRARLLTAEGTKVTFSDVAGCDEAKEELQEIIEFLKEPGKFQKLGGKIPKGALLLGNPGTGKTLLARAVAGEADVPFFSMSGSDFVEMFVGVGASRVRDLFDQGKKNAPCIIFIDEIDAVGRHRGAGLGGGHDEREQTLNQLLVEMDGFESNEGVILLAATNRPDVLDPALLRPGRFDRQIIVDQPDIKGREGILRVHVRKVNIDESVDLEVLARGTPGMSGAELANMVNEAALLAARKNHDKVLMDDMEQAKDKVMMGTERRSLVISEEEKKTTAYHEAGHALVARLMPKSDPVHKVTIIPRGMALGLTSYLPVDEKHTYSKEFLEGKLVHILGGRAAEKLIFGQLTTGAGNDIEQATGLARKMVCEWGMSDKLGPQTFGKKKEEIFLGREISQHRDYSETTAQLIDTEVRRIIETAQEKAIDLLEKNLDLLKKVAETLLERETLDGDELDQIIRGETLEELPSSVPEK